MEQLDALDHSILAVTGFHNPTDQRSLATLHRDRSHQMQCLLEELHLPCTAQGTPRYLIERTPVSPQDNAILSLMSCTAGLSLLARMLKAIHPAQVTQFSQTHRNTICHCPCADVLVHFFCLLMGCNLVSSVQSRASLQWLPRNILCYRQV